MNEWLSKNEVLNKCRWAEALAVVYKTTIDLDLTDSSKYSNENPESETGETFHVNSELEILGLNDIRLVMLLETLGS